MTAQAESTDAIVRQFVADGFAIVRGVFSRDDLDELTADVLRIARGAYPCPSLQPVPAELSDEAVLRNFLCIHQPHFVSPVIQQFVRHPRLCDVLSRLVAAHLPWWDGRVKCMQSMLFVKPPGERGQAWHQDEVYIPTRDRSLCGAWIAIDPATVANGCLWVLPGSHRSGYLYPQRPHQQPDEFDFADESCGFDDAQELPVELNAGDAVFFNGYLLHRSKRNRSEIFRRAIVFHYCNAWSLLPWEIKPGERPATADCRRVIPVVGADPYAWKGYEASLSDVWLRPLRTDNGR
ncbi:MAG: hypothetical protein CHACPFDD_02356 [Phycisphaerae bacterium]|nr:hypothetical protein [Phycisphaerae bacterium]